MQLPPPPPPIPEPGSRRRRRHCSYGRRHRRCRHHRLRSGPGKDVVAALRASRKRLCSLTVLHGECGAAPRGPSAKPLLGRRPRPVSPPPLPASGRACASAGSPGFSLGGPYGVRPGTAGLRTPLGSSPARHRPCLLPSGPEPSLWACQPRSFVAFKNCNVAEGERVPPEPRRPCCAPLDE